MPKLILKHLILGVLALTAISCTRNAKETSSIKLQLPNKVEVKKGLKTMSLPTDDGSLMLGHAVVNISGPGMTQQLISWDACKDCQFQPPAPQYFEMLIPRGDSRLVQVLLVYMSQDNQMYFYYGDATANVQADVVSVDVDMNQLGTGSEMISGAITGRYISSLGANSTLDQGPTGSVNVKYNPGNGKPSMIIEKGSIINGWFNLFALSNVPFDYVMDSGTVLFANKSLNSFTPDQRTAIAYLPQHHECWTDMGSVMCSNSGPREKEIVVLGYFGATGVDLSSKYACSSYNATAIDKWKKYDSADSDGPENNADVGSTKILYTTGSTTMGFDINNARAYVNSDNCSANPAYTDVLELKDINLSWGRHMVGGFTGPNMSLAGQPFDMTFDDTTKEMVIDLMLLPGLSSTYITSYDIYFGDMSSPNMHGDSIPCQELSAGQIGGWSKGADSILPVSNSNNFTVTTSVPQNHNKVAICAKKGTVTLNYGFAQEFFNGNSNCTNCNSSNGNGLIANLEFYDIPVNSCVGLEVELPIVSGNQVVSDGSTPVTFNANGFSAQFYDSNDCTGPAVTQIIIPNGDSLQTMSIKPTSMGSGSLHFAYSSYYVDLNGVNINSGGGGGGPQPVHHLAISNYSEIPGVSSPNQCIELSIEAKDQANNNITSDDSIEFDLTASASGDFYYIYDDCIAQTAPAIMPDILSAGQSSTRFYYRIPSDVTLSTNINFNLSNVTRSDSTTIVGNQSGSVLVVNGNNVYANLQLTHGVVAGLCYNGQVGLKKIDNSNFTQSFEVQFNVVLGLSFYTDASCTNSYSPTSVTQSAPLNFYFKYIKQGSENQFTITTAVSGIQHQNSRNIFIDASTNTAIAQFNFWRSQNQMYDLNSCYNLEISTQNSTGTPVPAGASTFASFTSTFAAEFYPNSNCSGGPSTSIQLPQGSNWTRISFKPTALINGGLITANLAGTSQTVSGIYVQTPTAPPIYYFNDEVNTDFSSGSFNNLIWDNSSMSLRMDRSSNVNDMLFNATWTPQFNNLVGYWPMDNNFSDLTTNYNHSIPQSYAQITNYHSKVGFGNLDLNQPNSYVSIADSSSLDVTSAFSVSSWVYMSPTATTGWLFGKNGDSFTTGYGIAIEGGTGKIWPHIGINGVLKLPKSVVGLINYQWNHVAVTYDGTNIKIYLNGSLDTTYPAPGLISVNTSDLHIGTSPIHPSQKLIAKIDDFAIWNVALTDTEINTIYNRQNANISLIGTFESRIFNGSGTRTWNSFEWVTRLPALKELPGDTNGDSIIDGNDSENYYSYTHISSNLMNDLVRLWHLNELNLGTGGGGTLDFKDFSGKNEWLTVNGTVNHDIQAQFLKGVRLSGTGSLTGSSAGLATGAGARTVSLWVNFASLPTLNNSMTLFSYGSQVNDQAYGLSIENSNGKYQLRNFGWNNDLAVPVYLEINKWNHFAVTYDGSYARIFHNGFEIGQLNIYFNTISSGVFHIGKNLDGTNLTNAIFDEVAIWNRSLYSPDVLQLYRRGSNRVLVQVRTCSDSTCSSGTTPWIGPDATNTTYFSELRNTVNNSIVDNILLGIPYMSFDNFSNIPSNYFSGKQYFQYKIIMESDDRNNLCYYGSGPHACVPELVRASIEYQ